jgi:hypothetical protein
MSKDLTVTLEDRPGALASMGEALGKAGVNIDGLCGVTVEGKGSIHILVADPAKAKRALAESKIPVAREEDVLVLDVKDRPGELGEIGRRLAGAGVNIHLAYLATSTRLVLGVDNLQKAQTALQSK